MLEPAPGGRAEREAADKLFVVLGQARPGIALLLTALLRVQLMRDLGRPLRESEGKGPAPDHDRDHVCGLIAFQVALNLDCVAAAFRFRQRCVHDPQGPVGKRTRQEQRDDFRLAPGIDHALGSAESLARRTNETMRAIEGLRHIDGRNRRRLCCLLSLLVSQRKDTVAALSAVPSQLVPYGYVPLVVRVVVRRPPSTPGFRGRVGNRDLPRGRLQTGDQLGSVSWGPRGLGGIALQPFLLGLDLSGMLAVLEVIAAVCSDYGDVPLPRQVRLIRSRCSKAQEVWVRAGGMVIALEAAAISRSKSTWGSVKAYFTTSAPRRSGVRKAIPRGCYRRLTRRVRPYECIRL